MTFNHQDIGSNPVDPINLLNKNYNNVSIIYIYIYKYY